jgi:hypothetical protein
MGKLSGLAGRFKVAIEADENRKKEEAEAEAEAAAEATRVAELAAAAKDEARAARKELFADIQALAKDLGMTVKKKRKSFVICHGDEQMTMTEHGDEDEISVDYGNPHGKDHIARSVAGDWLVTHNTETDEVHLPLEDGIMELFVAGLGLPRPGEQSEPAPTRRRKAPAKRKAGPKPLLAKSPNKSIVDTSLPKPQPKSARNEDVAGPAKSKKKRKGTPGGAVKTLSNPWD